MDMQTVTALCDLVLVVIGIIGLTLVRKERRAALAKKKPGHPLQ